MENKVLNLWTVYFNPSDHPNKYVVRRFEGDKPTLNGYVGKDYEDCIKWLKNSAKACEQGEPVKMERHPSDDPVIVETWI